MFNKLWVRFALILLVTALAAAVVSLYKPKFGIDLAGGIDLIYELNLDKNQGDTNDLANKVIETLKKRVDPHGVMNLSWRVISGKRIEIQMPMPSPEAKAAREAFKATEDALEAKNLRRATVMAALRRSGAERVTAMDSLVATGTARRAKLQDLAVAYDAKEAIEQESAKYTAENMPQELLDARPKTRREFDLALDDLLHGNIEIPRLNEMLEATDNFQDANAREQLDKFIAAHAEQKEQLLAVRASYDNLRRNRGMTFDDPADLQRLLRGAGVLDFRIAPTVADSDVAGQAMDLRMTLAQSGPGGKISVPNVKWFEVDPKNGEELVAELKDARPRFVGGVAPDNKTYILLYTDESRALTHNISSRRPQEWKLINPSTHLDPSGGGVVVSFEFDNPGGRYFGDLTTLNEKRAMAILLDDKAITAPNINEPITTGRGQITFGKGRPAETVGKEAERLVRMLEAGSLPATLQPEPISKNQISSTLGEDNQKAGLTSGVLAVLAVIAFMALYYTLSGTFADLAMLLNLLVTLAIMALFGTTWTLPGIAGLVLTLGMAVDANILINERIREELHRGASLWLAVRNGYEKVFWTIFDANTTTSMTAIVLIFVATEEVKGFGVTLLIGLIVHMFTALFVTRTFTMAAIKWGLLRQIDSWSVAEYLRDLLTFKFLRGRWPFLKIITVTNIDWIGKRHIFWAVSLILSAAGLFAFAYRGSDKYDTEFNGGTQVTFNLASGKSLKINDVRDRVTDSLAKAFDARSAELARTAASEPEPGRKAAELRDSTKFHLMAGDLRNATNVTEVIGEHGERDREFQIVTTIADSDEYKMVRDFTDGLKDQFKDVLDIQPALRFTYSQTPKDANGKDTEYTIEQLQEKKLLFPLTSDQPSLEKALPGVKAIRLADDDISDYVGGVAIKLDFQGEQAKDFQTVKELTERISRKQQSPEFKIPYRPVKVVPLAYFGAETGDNAKVKTALVLAADPVVGYQKEGNNTTWRDTVARPEWRVITAALAESSSLQGVASFDAQVAGEAKMRALVAVGISLLLIVIYVWIRFGGIRYGMGAILSLLHDAIIALGATVLSGWIYQWVFKGEPNPLLIGDFKVNLTAIAAYLTIIGYSVNDTIVIFDRIRENRGRSLQPLTSKLVNDSINQCFGRTIWTTFTVFIVVLIMYIWGGVGIRGFAFAMLIGVFTGAYSTLAIASPTLLSVRERGRSKAEMAEARSARVTDLTTTEE